MRQFVLDAIKQLVLVNPKDWARLFIKLRFEFHNKYQKKDSLIISTIHGGDFFTNVLECLNGKEWKEEGYFGDNFRKIIQLGLKENAKIKTQLIPTAPEDLNEIEKLKVGKGN